ncbi:MAG: glycine cleavage T C-terminal barrel domain-containing protein, partial [Bryobacteraceae bacterium]
NTLRLEAKMALYGHEIDATVRPPEADLDWIVKMNKGEFVGRAALERLAATGIRRKLVGFEMRERVIARDGYPVYVDGRPAGWVTSGGPAPYLNKNIGLCFLPVEFASPGRTIHIGIRGRLAEALTVRTPFYKRPKTNQ